ncbi:MAG: hypothetical protein LBB08_02310, partial [Rickettsiales bacterium]|nr:hypothetical protein [Rickettsiales bacterium]
MAKKFVVFILALGAACAKRESQQVASTVDQDFVNAFEAFEMSKNPRAKIVNDTVSTSEGIWLGDSSTMLAHKNSLPKEFETDSGITILLGDPVSLQVLANNIHSITGISVKIDSKIANDKLKKTMNVGFTGKLSQLLSQVATDLDLLWYYDKESIVFFETETRTFSLYALGTDISYQSSIRSEDGNSVAMESNLKEWEEIETAISGIIGSSENAKFTVSKSLGTITVTAPPSILTRVGDYIGKQNKRLSQLVTIDVKVLQVSISNDSAFGLNLGAAINAASGLSIAANPAMAVAAAGASSMNIAVLGSTATNPTNGSLGALAGTSAL